MKNPTENAFIAQDGIGGYDWSYQAEEKHPTNYALMSLTSLGISSSSDFTVDSCSITCIKAYATLKEQYDSLSSDYKKSQFNFVSYKAGLQSVEERLAHYKKNEVVFEEKINILNLEVKLRDNALVENTKKLEKAEKERHALGYKAASLAVESFVNSSEMLENQKNIKSRSDKGYHAVPPPYTWNYIPAKPDLMFIDEQVESESVDVVSNVTSSDIKTVDSKHEPISNAFKIGHSQVRRPYNKYSAYKKTIFNKMVNTVRVKDTTARERAVKEYKEKEVIDSGCSRNMIGNKCYLTDYEDYDGGFVSFGDDKGRIYGKVIKPHNKTPYELIRGRPPLIDFMKPFGCLVTILNTRDSLGKIDGKVDEGIFVGHFMDSAVDAAKKATKVDESRVSDNGGQDDQVTRSEFEGLLQQERQTEHINSTNSFNSVVSPVNTAGPSFANTTSPSQLNAAGTPATVEEEVDMNNVVSSYIISDAPLTKFLKGHTKDQVIGSIETPIQTRQMTKINEEHDLISSVQKLRRTGRRSNLRIFNKWYESLVRSFDRQKNKIQALQKKKMIKTKSTSENEPCGSKDCKKNNDSLNRYSAVPPPVANLYLSPKKDLSWTGLPECADDTVTDYSRPSPTVESTTEDGQNINSFASKNGEPTDSILSKPAVKFVKAVDRPAERPMTNKAKTVKKPTVKYAEMYRRPSKKPTVKGNQRNWNNLKTQQPGPDFVMKKKACFNCGDFNYLAYDCRKRVKRGTTRSQNNTYKSPLHRPGGHRPHGPPMRPMRSNMNESPKAGERVESKSSYSQGTKLEDSVRTKRSRGTRNLKIQKLNIKFRGGLNVPTAELRVSPAEEFALLRLLSATITLSNKAEDPISEFSTSGMRACAVPPPVANLYLSPKKDLSWTGLPECADDTVTDYSRPSPTVESTTEDGQNRNSFASKNGEPTDSILSKPAVKFVKAVDRPIERPTINKAETVNKPTVKYAEMYRRPSKKPTVRGNQRNWNNLKTQQLGSDFVMKKKACFNCGDFNHLAYDCRKR
nr:retrovirus-related Pol polyprotein from transposon TNT 1-94 [Tanacetum cinerariifolium]